MNEGSIPCITLLFYIITTLYMKCLENNILTCKAIMTVIEFSPTCYIEFHTPNNSCLLSE